MELPIYQVDAFAGKAFEGNPAAVVPLESWLDDALLQSIASENNLSETAYFVREQDHFQLRWFTPAAEVDLCGHATLASAFVIATYLDPSCTTLKFLSRSGLLEVTKEGDFFTLDFPKITLEPSSLIEDVESAIGQKPVGLWQGMDHFVLLPDEGSLRALDPDQAKVAALGLRGLVATAKGESVDFVSRFFAPNHGIPEDPVTGSTHCALTPFWSERLGKSEMTARQLSRRGGELRVRDKGERILIAGPVAPYMIGTISI